MTMRIAVCAYEMSQVERMEEHFSKWIRRGAPLETECYLKEEDFFYAVKKGRYDLIIIYLNESWYEKEEMLQLLKEKRDESCIVFLCGKRLLPHSLFEIKYEAQFNGHFNVIDAEDIIYLESYDRKTSIVTKDKKIRIKGRLDIEEQKFSDYQFARISRWNVINMRYVHNLEDDAVYMTNGDKLYISSSRRKGFFEKYRQYVRENCRVV